MLRKTSLLSKSYLIWNCVDPLQLMWSSISSLHIDFLIHASRGRIVAVLQVRTVLLVRHCEYSQSCRCEVVEVFVAILPCSEKVFTASSGLTIHKSCAGVSLRPYTPETIRSKLWVFASAILKTTFAYPSKAMNGLYQAIIPYTANIICLRKFKKR